MMNESFSIIKKIILNANNVAVLPHILPDGDAIGSSCALATLLQGLNKNAKVYLQAQLPLEYKYFFVDDIIEYRQPEDVDLVIITDCAGIDRVGSYSNLVKKCDNTLAIDHHKTFIPFAKHNFVSTVSSSASEYIYDILMDQKFVIDKRIAEFLYLGILRDTGGFMHDCTTPHTMRIVADLLDYKIDAENINRHFMMRTSYKTTMLLKTALNNLKMYNLGKIAVSHISLDDLTKYKALVEDSAGVVNHILSIDTVEVAVLITEANQDVHKISIRSKNKVDASEIVKDFGGGGHAKAAGCQLRGKIFKIIHALVNSIQKRM